MLQRFEQETSVELFKAFLL